MTDFPRLISATLTICFIVVFQPLLKNVMRVLKKQATVFLSTVLPLSLHITNFSTHLIYGVTMKETDTFNGM
jgi:hypothetical protein